VERELRARMRVALLTASIVVGICLGACSSDGTDVSIPRGSDGLLGGSGSPALPSKDPGTTDTDAGGPAATVGQPSTDGGGASTSDAAGGDDPTPLTDADVGTADAESPATGDGSATPEVAGCTCGCADPCLTELITDCKAPSIELVLVCPKVPATCTCEANCAAVPAEPSLTQCIAQFLLTGG
jgi:hypothetical protein